MKLPTDVDIAVDEGEQEPLNLGAAMYLRNPNHMSSREKGMAQSACDVQAIDNMVKKLVGLQTNQFAMSAGAALTDKDAGNELLLSLGVTLNQRERFPKATFSPRFELFERHSLRQDFSAMLHNMYLGELPGYRMSEKERLGCVQRLNTFVGDMRRESRSPQFIKLQKDHVAVTQKNQAGLVSFLDKALKDYGSVLVVGLEVAYNVNHAVIQRPSKAFTFAQMKAHRERLLEFVQDEWGKECVGVAWALGHESEGVGYNNHLLLLFNERTQEHLFEIARVLGQYWKYIVTDRHGCFHNCNRHAPRFPYGGLGIIEYGDVVGRQAFADAASLLTAADHFVRLTTRGDNPNFSKRMYKQKRGVRLIKRKKVAAPIVEVMPWRTLGSILGKASPKKPDDEKSTQLSALVTPFGNIHR